LVLLFSGPNTGFVYTSLYVRHWDAYVTEGKHNSLFVLRLAKTVDGTTDSRLVPVFLLICLIK
jgi:hypothetical protein